EAPWFVRNLHDAVWRAVVNAATDNRRRTAVDQLVGRSVAVIDEEHASIGFQSVGNESPERLEPLFGHVREPEGEEDDVVATLWRPREEIGLDEARAVVADSCRRDGQHLRRRIHGGDARGMAEEQLSPRAGAAREPEHTAGEPE